jgi:hypothetical protein
MAQSLESANSALAAGRLTDREKQNAASDSADSPLRGHA